MPNSCRGEADGSSWEATTDVDARARGTWVALDEMIRRRSPEISLSTLEAILDLETIGGPARGRRVHVRAPGDGSAQLDIFRGKNLREGRFTPEPSAASSSARASWRRVAPSILAWSLTASTPTSSSPATRTFPTCTRSSVCATDDPSPPGVWWLDRRARRSSTCPSPSRLARRASHTRVRCRAACPLPRASSQEELARRFRDPRVPDAMRGYLLAPHAPLPIDLRSFARASAARMKVARRRAMVSAAHRGRLTERPRGGGETDGVDQ